MVTTPRRTGAIFAHAARPSAEENRIIHMATTTRRWTLADLEHMPDDGNTYELVRGKLFVTPAPRNAHQEIVAALNALIAPYVWKHALGQIHHPRAIVMIDGSQVEPDLMVRPSVSPPLPSWEDMPLPLLIVEVLSDTTRRRDLVDKRELYTDIGIAEYWIVDGDTRTFTVVRSNGKETRVSDTVLWHPSGAAEPLAIDVGAFFERVLGVTGSVL
jgi:Uma2 family endonuclease